ncbi:MAG TPA: hypothetical protein VGM31_17765, partial [Puia sp.]
MHRTLLMILLACCSHPGFTQKSYVLKDGLPYAASGLPVSPLWFADSRMAFSFDDAGIQQLDYYSPIAHQNQPTIFLRQLWDGFRYYLLKDGKRYKPHFSNSTIWPFGIESDWLFGPATIHHRVMAVDEGVVIQITTPSDLPSGITFSLEFYELSGLSRGSDDDLRYTNAQFTRKWLPWRFDTAGHRLTGGFTSNPVPSAAQKGIASFDTWCVLGSSFPLQHIPRGINPKHILVSPELAPGKTYTFLLSFGNSQEAAIQRNQRELANLDQRIERQFSRYRQVLERSPILESPYPALNDFIRMAPMYHESLKIIQTPGPVRAKTTNYWIWAWDGLTSNDAVGYWGDTAYLRNTLSFYEKKADTTYGIGHALEYDNSTSGAAPLPEQGMFITLLQLYYQHTHDIATVKERYPFAKKIFSRLAGTEVQGTGLCKGSSVFPDFPVAMEENGNDISGFNNTVYYATARSMQWLAGLVGDKALQKKAGEISSRIERHFLPLFFNKEKGFIVSSIDATSLAQRDSYTINSIRWENDFCRDLVSPIDTACLSFFSKYCVTPMGIREIPTWSKAYDKDANQFHDWWPATGEYFMRLINQFDKPALINEWIGWVGYWTGYLTCPEGTSNYIETNTPEFDRWTSQKATWQAYSTRAWYGAALHSVVGVDADPGGITVYPYSGEEMTLKGMHYLGRRLNIHMKGSGPYVDSITVNDITLKGTCKIPDDIYRSSVSQEIFV